MALNARFEVHAGDFKAGKNNYFVYGSVINKPYMKIRKPWKLFAAKVKVNDIELVEVASEEAVQRVGGAVGWGIAGGALLGPAGLLVGLLRGGRGKNITFVCQLKDGRRFLATAPSKMFNELSAACFK